MMSKIEDDDVDVCGGSSDETTATSSSSLYSSLVEIQNVPTVAIVEHHDENTIEQKTKTSSIKLSKKRSMMMDDTAAVDSDDGLDAQSRKQKSLGLLCQRFVITFY